MVVVYHQGEFLEIVRQSEVVRACCFMMWLLTYQHSSSEYCAFVRAFDFDSCFLALDLNGKSLAGCLLKSDRWLFQTEFASDTYLVSCVCDIKEMFGFLATKLHLQLKITH